MKKQLMKIKKLNLQLRNSVASIFYQVQYSYWLYLGVQPLQDIDEVNMFKDDNTVINFKKPSSSFPIHIQ